MKVVFPDGTTVTGCGLAERRELQAGRDFGLYLDPAWAPTWPAEIVEWEDFGVPADWPKAADQIARAFARARDGDGVEVGCRGGLGRTGTVLACMAVLAGVPSSDAVAWVRRNYRGEAIETEEQEQWVLWFARWTENGGEARREPMDPSSEGGLRREAYYIMLGRGVSVHRSDCRLVGRPEERYWRGPFTRSEAVDAAERTPATMILSVCEGDCDAERMARFLDVAPHEGWNPPSRRDDGS